MSSPQSARLPTLDKGVNGSTSPDTRASGGIPPAISGKQAGQSPLASSQSVVWRVAGASARGAEARRAAQSRVARGRHAGAAGLARGAAGAARPARAELASDALRRAGATRLAARPARGRGAAVTSAAGEPGAAGGDAAARLVPGAAGARLGAHGPYAAEVVVARRARAAGPPRGATSARVDGCRDVARGAPHVAGRCRVDARLGDVRRGLDGVAPLVDRAVEHRLGVDPRRPPRDGNIRRGLVDSTASARVQRRGREQGARHHARPDGGAPKPHGMPRSLWVCSESRHFG